MSTGSRARSAAPLRCVPLTLALAVLLTAAPARGANPVQAENALPGDSSWRLGLEPPPHAIEGYASSTSVAPGGSIVFAVSTAPAARYRIVIARLGWYGGLGGRLHACLPDPDCVTDKAGVEQPPAAPPDPNGEVDARWPPTDSLTIPADWVSGYYVARLILTTGDHAGDSVWIPFVVRAPSGQSSRLLVQEPVNTWQAYNMWGGKNLYRGDATTDGARAVRVSFDRPYTYRVLVTGEEASFNHYELPLVRFVEREGYDAAYATDVDVSRAPAQLLDHRLVMTAGHGEYWTKSMRDGFEAARDLGTNLAFMGANTAYWQVRYADGGRTIVSYKSQHDPIRDPQRKTVRFRNLKPARPECKLIGVQHQSGVGALGDRRGYSLTSEGAADRWNAETGLVAGATVPYLVGYEWDVTLPWCHVPHSKVLFQWVRPEGDPSASDAQAVRYTAPSGARVFGAGAMQFSWGLSDPDDRLHTEDPGIQRFTETALDDLTRPARPSAIAVERGPSRFVVRLARHADPRFAAFEVFAHAGRSKFQVGDAGVRRVCRTRHDSCSVAPAAGYSTERFGGVVLDRLGRISRLRFAAPVRSSSHS